MIGNLVQNWCAFNAMAFKMIMLVIGMMLMIVDCTHDFAANPVATIVITPMVIDQHDVKMLLLYD
jgi:hypothetical protein